MRSRVMDVKHMLDRIRHKAATLDEVLDYPSDRAASRALGIPRSTISKWRQLASFSSKRGLLSSLAGIPGRKICKPVPPMFDDNEGEILTFADLFPEWNEFGIANALGVLGHEIPVEDIRLVLRSDRIRRGLEEPGDPLTPVAQPAEERVFDKSLILNMIFERTLEKLLQERPLRAGFHFTEIAQDIASYGQQLIRLSRSISLEAEGIDVDGIERQFQDLAKQAQMVRKVLLAPFKTGGVEVHEEFSPDRHRDST